MNTIYSLHKLLHEDLLLKMSYFSRDIKQQEIKQQPLVSNHVSITARCLLFAAKLSDLTPERLFINII